MANAAAVAHYQTLAQQAAVMAGAQSRYDNSAPDDAPRGLVRYEAEDIAETELLTTAEPAADWIAKQCDTLAGQAPIDTLRITAHDILDTTSVPHLLALILAGDSQQTVRAADRLARLYKRAEAQQISDRADELLAADRKERGL